jgi:hypothetical protein
MSSSKKPVDRATFYTVDKNGKNDKEILQVMFNPASLTYTIANQMKEEGKDKKQHVAKSTAKLAMDLIFDTTDSGKDVREVTTLLAKLMGPTDKKSNSPYLPQVVALDWGSFRFKGMVEQFKETIDFFAPEGVPLRSTVNISLSNQEKVFEDDTEKADATHIPQEQALVAVGEGQDVGDIAKQTGGDARTTAADNGIENLRMPGTGVLAISASVQLSPPTAFASGGASLSAGGGLGLSAGAGIGLSAGAGIGLSAGGGIGLSAGAGISASAGVSFGASASAGVSVGVSARGIGAIGGGSSAGVSATGGAFAGLRTSPPVLPRVSVNVERAQQSGSAASGATGFSVGGRATADGASGLSADVGATATLRVGSGISFDE